MATVLTITVPTAPPLITVNTPGPVGPGNIKVGPTNTLQPGLPGLWIQTGLGPSGTDMSFWVEDGT